MSDKLQKELIGEEGGLRPFGPNELMRNFVRHGQWHTPSPAAIRVHMRLPALRRYVALEDERLATCCYPGKAPTEELEELQDDPQLDKSRIKHDLRSGLREVLALLGRHIPKCRQIFKGANRTALKSKAVSGRMGVRSID